LIRYFHDSGLFAFGFQMNWSRRAMAWLSVALRLESVPKAGGSMQKKGRKASRPVFIGDFLTMA
jgi:hypothetical protein